MISRMILLLLAFCFSVRAASPERSTEKLRSLAMLPKLNLSVSAGFSSSDLEYPERSRRTDDWPQVIAALRKQLQNDPSDAERLTLIGLYLEDSQKEEAKQAFSKAAEMFRIRAEARPQDGPLQSKFASALMRTDRHDEAERIMRATLQVISNDWTCWMRLGSLLANKAVRTLGLEPGSNSSSNSKERQSPSAPTASQIRESESYRKEAEECFDRAVALAANVPGPYQARAMYRSSVGPILAMTRQSADENLQMKTFFTQEACADWARAARLGRTNLVAIAYWAMSESMIGAENQEGATLFNRLTDSRRGNVLEAVRMLEELGNRSGPRAAEALAILGALRLGIMQDLPTAESAFRRAVSLDPLNTQAWDGLVGAAVQEKDRAKLVSVCEERLRHADIARNRVAAAKACDRAHLSDAALKHARQAVELDPQDPVTQISVGALLLRQSKGEVQVKEAKGHLNRARILIKNMQEGEERDRWFITTGINIVVGSALENDLEGARDILSLLESLLTDNGEFEDHLRELRLVVGK